MNKDDMLELYKKAMMFPDVDNIDCYTSENLENNFNLSTMQISLLDGYKVSDLENQDIQFPETDGDTYFESSKELIEFIDQIASIRFVSALDNKALRDLSEDQSRFIYFLTMAAFMMGQRVGTTDATFSTITRLFTEHTILDKKYTPQKLISIFSSQVGGQKNILSRNKAIEWLKLKQSSNYSLSGNKLATLLHEASKENKKLFGRVIPFSTCRDYARKVKNEEPF